MTRNVKRNTVADFWPKVDVKGPADCWNWTRGKDRMGYGFFKLGGKDIKTHRLAFKLANGYLPDDLCVCHRCDNPACCNPAHLFLGTRKDNNADKMAKGRFVALKGAKNGSCLHPETRPRGENHGNAKLTNEQVREIRALYSAGGHTHVSLAEKFGVGRQTICNIVNRSFWKSV